MPEDRIIGHIPVPPLEELKRGTNYFFAIGINNYKNFKKLSNARKDVEDIAEVLTENYYFEKKNVQLLCDESATKYNILNEFQILRRKIQSDDRLIVYYAGHGIMDDDFGFWIPVDAEFDSEASYIRNAEVRDIIKSIRARHILLISDSCFSGSLLVREATREIEGTFLDWERKPSRLVFISGEGVVSDGLTNSPFAAGIIENLIENKDEALNINLLADRVTKEVRFNHQQKAELTPLFDTGHKGGQFVFFKKQTERDDWEAALKTNLDGAYVSFRRKYPNGLFAEAALNKLKEIADEKEWKKAALIDEAFAYEDYLTKYPKGIHASEATAKLIAIEDKAEEEARLAKIEADKKEAVRIERESLAKIKADEDAHIERERLAKIEAVKVGATLAVAQKLERERLAKIKADEDARIERERLAKIKADEEAASLERERLSKIEANKIETARLAKIEADKKEHARLAKIKADDEAARLAVENNQQQQNSVTPSVFQKYRAPIIGGGVFAAGLLIWQLTAGNGKTETPTTNTPLGTSVQENNSPTTQSAQPVYLPPTGTANKPVETQIKSFKKTADEIKAKADGQPQQTKKIYDDNKKSGDKSYGNLSDYNTIDHNQLVQADNAAAQKYLKNALRFIEAGEYSSASSALSSANYLNYLSPNAKKYINNATRFIEAYEYDSAKSSISAALNAIR